MTRDEATGALLRACRSGVLADALAALDAGGDAAVGDPLFSNTPLYYAAERGHTGIVEMLLEKGASTAARNIAGWTPLHFSAAGGHIAASQLLIDRDADPNATDAGGATPLHYATAKGHTGLVQLLLDSGADARVENDLHHRPLDYATKNNHTALVQTLQAAELRTTHASRLAKGSGERSEGHAATRTSK